MELSTKEDLINIIKGLTTDVASLQETVTSLTATNEETTNNEESQTSEGSNGNEAPETSEEEVDEIHKLLSGE